MSSLSKLLIVLLFLLLLPPAIPTLAAPVPATLSAPASAIPNGTYDWLQFNFDVPHSGVNPLETTITPTNVNQLKLLFQVSNAGRFDGAPVYLSSVTTASGIQDLLFLSTTDGIIMARNALTGALVWSKQHGPGACHINNGADVCYTISSPTIDPNRQYVYSYGLDGYVHKYQVGDGKEIKTGGFPERVTYKPYNEKGTANLTFATAKNGHTFLYMASSGYPTDAGDYQGHVTVIDLANGVQRVFNALCSNQAVHFIDFPNVPSCPYHQAAIWGRPGVVYSAATNRIYMTTSNGFFDPSRNLWGDSVLALNPNGTGANGWPVDSFTPTNYQYLQDHDLDLGSNSPALLPTPATSKFQHLAVQSGKDGVLRLLNLDDLSKKGGPGHTGGAIGRSLLVPQGGEVRTQATVWVNPSDSTTWVFIANDEGISALQLNVDAKGVPHLQQKWVKGKAKGGSSPIVVNNILFYAGPFETLPGFVAALNPTSGQVLWTGSNGLIHASSPIVANGVLYITDHGQHIRAYSLNGVPPAQR